MVYTITPGTFSSDSTFRSDLASNGPRTVSRRLQGTSTSSPRLFHTEDTSTEILYDPDFENSTIAGTGEAITASGAVVTISSSTDGAALDLTGDYINFGTANPFAAWYGYSTISSITNQPIDGTWTFTFS